jgi:tetratricopeptide (TPR) repeat protein
MLTIKNRVRDNVLILLTFLGLLAGCMPPGPRAVLDGKRLIDQGNYAEAVDKLRTATSLIPTNALAWSYLGLAQQHLGQRDEAIKDYSHALSLNRDLSEVHYNLGCLWLEQNKLDAARTEFTAFTLRRGNSVPGFLKLAAVQARLRDLVAAEKSYNDVLRLSPQNSEALNGLGLIRVQQRRPTEAQQYFAAALKPQPDYRPALLNSAVVAHQYLQDLPAALQKYRAYLALKPPPPNAEAIAATIRQIEQDLTPPARPPTSPKPAPTSVASNLPSKLSPPSAPVAQPSKPIPTNPQRVLASPKAEASGTTPKPLSSPPVNPTPPPEIQPAKAAPETVVKPSAEPAPVPVPNQRPPADGFSHYNYRSPAPPAAGNRAEAERWFSQGLEAQNGHRLADAIQAYRTATQLDPGFFKAYYNLALAAAEAGNLPTALTSYEYALAIEPESDDARYNFALLLKQANCATDAARELERLLTIHPNEARAHLALANIYAQQLHQPAAARPHYLRFLELEPRNPQANTIRYWLQANSR